jgi:hypothetical protein
MKFKYSSSPWLGGHFIDPEHSCNCDGIVAFNGKMGSIATITIDNGKSISEGGNDGPSLEEAIANNNLIVKAPDMHIAHVENARLIEMAIKIIKENGKMSEVVDTLNKCLKNSEKSTAGIE